MMKWTARLLAGLLLTAAVFSGPAARSQEERPRFTVLTLNVWGIIGAKERAVRAEAIGRKIAAMDPDIVAIEEAFEARHRRVLLRSLEKNGYQMADWKYFRNIYGSGVLFISKFPIESAMFKPYRVIGGVNNIEWLGGKGIAVMKLKTPWGPLDFFSTHAIARMTPIFDARGNYIPGDPCEVDRFLHMYQIDQFVREERNQLGRSIIAAGDFNVSPEMPEYPFLMAKSGFESSFEIMNPGENPSTFSVENAWVEDDYSRIDHIFFKNYEGSEGFWLRPVESHVDFNERFSDPKTTKDINYSDHYGLVTVFEVVAEPDVVSPSPPGVTRSKCDCDECPLTGYSGGAVELTSQNAGAWRDAALDVFREVYDKQERRRRLLIPMAAIVAAWPVNEPVKIAIPADVRDDLAENVCGSRCTPPASN